jgi:8-oxo-dGTP pyrophosphatase MutT (NUDIX family)
MLFIEAIKKYECVNRQEVSDKKVMLQYIKDYKNNILTRDNKIAHLTSSGFIMNESLTKVLMIHHNIYNTWAWTGGHADGEEDLLAVAVKEAKEETGLKTVKTLSRAIASIDILPVNGHIKKDKYVSAHLHLNVAYLLIANEQHSLSINKKETSGVKWVKTEEIADHSKEPELIKIYKKLTNRGKAHSFTI